MYQVGSHGIGYYWDVTNWGMIYTTIITMWMIASLIAPNIGQESRGYVVGIWRGHTKSIITWNCIYFIAKVDGWLQKYGMIPPTWYIQPSSHTTIHWLQLATSNQPNTILYICIRHICYFDANIWRRYTFCICYCVVQRLAYVHTTYIN